MVSKAFITTIGLDILATAAPQKRQSALGVYMCPKPNFAVDAAVPDATACRWRQVPAGVCNHLHWFDNKSHAAAERHTSFAPDKGNFCTLFEDFKCDKTKNAGMVTPAEGIMDVFAAHKKTSPNSTDQFISYMCSPTSVEASYSQAVVTVT